MSTLAFFPGSSEDEAQQVYRKWIATLPRISLLREDTGDDPNDEYFPDVEGPYFLTTHYLALRVGRPFYVLYRVEHVEEADFSWYLPSPDGRGTSETVYAAYLRDGTPRREPIQGTRISSAKSTLSKFLENGAPGQHRTRALGS